MILLYDDGDGDDDDDENHACDVIELENRFNSSPTVSFFLSLSLFVLISSKHK